MLYRCLHQASTKNAERYLRDFVNTIVAVDSNSPVALQGNQRLALMSACHAVSISKLPTSSLEERMNNFQILDNSSVEVPEELYGVCLTRFVQDDLVDASTMINHLPILISRLNLTRHKEQQPPFNPLNPTLDCHTGSPAEINQLFKDLFNMVMRSIISFSQQSDANLTNMIEVSNQVEDNLASWSVEDATLQATQQSALLAIRSATASCQLFIVPLSACVGHEQRT